MIGDLKDAASLAAIARRTKVVIAMAGPYAKFGEPVVEACLAEGAHYVDITGGAASPRPPWSTRQGLKLHRLDQSLHMFGSLRNGRFPYREIQQSFPSSNSAARLPRNTDPVLLSRLDVRQASGVQQKRA